MQNIRLLWLTYMVAPAMPNGHVLLGNLITRRHKASILLALLALPYVSHAARAADFLPVRYPVCGE